MSLPLWVKRCCAKSKKSANAKKLFYVHLDNVVLNFTEFKKNILSDGWNRFVAGRATCSVDDQVGDATCGQEVG